MFYINKFSNHETFWVLFFSSLFVFPTYGQQNIILATKINEKITIDGNVDEPVWNEIIPLKLSQKVPNYGNSPTQSTEIRMAYDDKYLYLSGRMFDKEPDKIVANTQKRDDFTENTEWCGLIIDSYNDRENALAFFVTPKGSRLDMGLSNDMAGPNSFNINWNTIWDAAAIINNKGWFAEIRIPFSSIPFEVVNDKVTMGITVWRYLARNDETDIYPPRDLSTGSSFRASLTQPFLFEGIKKNASVRLTPYILTSLESATQYSQDELYVKTNNLKSELGVDAKITLNSNLTLDLTANTDFAQVEVDDQQINFTRFNLFFPEKRLFFQERAGLFDFNFGSIDNLFYSRRIGINNGQPSRIYGGARIVNKIDKWESGAFTIQSQSNLLQGKSENFSLFRTRRNIYNKSSNIGFILTNRSNFSGKYNTVYGVDANLKILEQNFIYLKWAQTFDDKFESKLNPLESSKFYIELDKRSQKGLYYNVSFSNSGKNYLPAMGFERRDNFHQFTTNLAYNIFPSINSKISQLRPFINDTYIWGNASESLESRLFQTGFQFLTKLGWNFQVIFNSNYENLLQPLSLPGGYGVEPNEYIFNYFVISATTPAARKIAYNSSYEFGNFYNGKKSTFSFSPIISISQNLQIESFLQYNKLRFYDTSKSIVLSSLKLQYTFNTKLTISTQMQYNNLDNKIFSNFRLRFNPKEGNDFYLVYNGGSNSILKKFISEIQFENSQNIILKYNHTFAFTRN